MRDPCGQSLSHAIPAVSSSRHDVSSSAIAPFEEAIVVLSADGTIAAWNPGASALYGYTEAEALGRLLDELLPTTWPEPPEAVAGAVARAGGWSGVVVRRDRDGGALLLLAIRVRAPEEPGGAVETSLPLPQHVAAVSLVPGEDDSSDRLFVLEPVRDDAGEIVDMDVRYANVEAAAAIGRVPEQLVGRRASELLPGYCDSPMFATHRKVIETGRPAVIADRRVELPPGSGIVHVHNGMVVPFGAGVASRSRDVTAERRALQALDDAQARVRMALAVAPVTVGQLNRDLEYEWLLDNLTLLDPAEAIGQPLGFSSLPEDAERLRAAARRVMETGATERLEIRGGAGFEEFTALAVLIAPRADAEDRSCGVRIALTDVSLHRRLEAELRGSRDMLRAVLEHTPGAVLVKDLDGRILFLNERAAGLLGTTAADAVDRMLADLVTPEEAEGLSAHDAEVLRTGEDVEVREDVGDSVLLVRRFPIRDADGQIRALGSIGLDLGRAPRPAADAGVTAPPAP